MFTLTIWSSSIEQTQRDPGLLPDSTQRAFVYRYSCNVHVWSGVRTYLSSCVPTLSFYAQDVVLTSV